MGTLICALPFVEGESLRERLAREGELPIAGFCRRSTSCRPTSEGRCKQYRSTRPRSALPARPSTHQCGHRHDGRGSAIRDIRGCGDRVSEGGGRGALQQGHFGKTDNFVDATHRGFTFARHGEVHQRVYRIQLGDDRSSDRVPRVAATRKSRWPR
jgi:hypothetical protein